MQKINNIAMIKQSILKRTIMKFLYFFLWSQLLFAQSCPSYLECYKKQISSDELCPQYVCDGKEIYHCKVTDNPDGTKTCDLGYKANSAEANCKCNESAKEKP